MTITKMLIGFIIMITVVIGLGEYYTSTLDVYQPSIYNAENTTYYTSAANFSQFNTSFDKLNTLMNQTSEHVVGLAKKSIFDPTKYFDVLNLMWDVGGIMFTIPSIMMTSISQLFAFLPIIPTWFKAMIVILILVIIVLRVASIFMKTEEI